MNDDVRSRPPTPPAASLSKEARSWASMLLALPSNPAPAPDDVEAWRAATRAPSSPEQIAAIALATTGAVPTGAEVDVAELPLSEAVVQIGTPRELGPGDTRVLLNVHGGAFTTGGGETTRVATQFMAGCYGFTVWGVDYRMPPDHPFPAALDDCLEAYRRLLDRHDPASIAIYGLSAGGNLVAALLLRIHEESLPMPRAVVLNSPLVDLTLSGDTIVSKPYGDEGSIAPHVAIYAGGNDVRHPHLSPLRAAIPADWPPTVLISGTRDYLLSDTVRMHRALLDSGVRAELHVFDGAPHGMFGGTAPEDRAVVSQIRRFLDSVGVGTADLPRTSCPDARDEAGGR